MIEILQAVAKRIEAEKDFLTQLDNEIGDGDHELVAELLVFVKGHFAVFLECFIGLLKVGGLFQSCHSISIAMEHFHDIILGRTDDMIKIKAVNIYPGQIEDVLKEVPGVSSEYQVVLDRGADYKDFMQYTTAGKTSFITCLYIIFVPLFAVLLRKRIRPENWLGAVLALTGLYFLCVKEDLTLSYGDTLVFISAFFWTFHILFIDRYAAMRGMPIPMNAGAEKYFKE